MSDDDPKHFNAWTQVMSTEKKSPGCFAPGMWSKIGIYKNERQKKPRKNEKRNEINFEGNKY